MTITLQFIDLLLLAPGTFSDNLGSSDLRKVGGLFQERILPFLAELDETANERRKYVAVRDSRRYHAPAP